MSEANLVPPSGSLPVIESEFLIARWEGKADELEKTAEHYRAAMSGLVAVTLEKARAYRACVEDLRRHTALTNKRQPEENCDYPTAVRVSDPATPES